MVISPDFIKTRRQFSENHQILLFTQLLLFLIKTFNQNLKIKVFETRLKERIEVKIPVTHVVLWSKYINHCLFNHWCPINSVIIIRRSSEDFVSFCYPFSLIYTPYTTASNQCTPRDSQFISILDRQYPVQLGLRDWIQCDKCQAHWR